MFFTAVSLIPLNSKLWDVMILLHRTDLKYEITDVYIKTDFPL